MTPLRKTAFVAGLLYLITYLAIPTIALYGPVLSDPAFIVSSANDTGVLWGAVLELIVAFAIVGTGVALFPVLRRQNEGVALGFVTARLFEAGVITVGILSLLSIVTLQQEVGATAGTDAGSLVIVGQSLVATHDWSFLIGQTLLPGINALLLGSLFYTVPPRAARHPADGPDRWPAVDLVRDRPGDRHQRAVLRVVGHRRPADLPVGAPARPLAGVQGLQDRPGHRTRWPGAGNRAGIRRRLTGRARLRASPTGLVGRGVGRPGQSSPHSSQVVMPTHHIAT